MFKKEILFITPTLTGAGAERVLCHIINNIDATRYKVSLLLVLKAEHTFLAEIPYNVKIIKIESQAKLKRNIPTIISRIKKINPDIIFVANGHLGLLLSPIVPFLRKYKWIMRETNFASINTEKFSAKIFYRFFLKNYDKIICQCNDMESDLINAFNIPKHKISVINNPVDTAFIDSKLNETEPNVTYQKNKTNIVACGRLTYQKGFDSLITAFSVMENKNNYHLTIIGSGEGDSRDVTHALKEQVNRLTLNKYITFICHQKNIYHWLSKADVFILSSRFEGFPNILLEAMYCGSQVLSNNCPGGIKDIIKNRENGLIFNIQYDDLEDKLIELKNLNIPSNKIKDSIKYKFGVEAIIKKYEDLL